MNSSEKRNSRNRLIEDNEGFVQGLVGQMVKTYGLPPDRFDEFVSAGYLGLVEAAERFDFNNGKPFRTYAYHRIKGAVIDSIRKSSDVSGRAYKYAKAMQAMHDAHGNWNYDAGEEERSGNHHSSERLVSIMNYASKGALAFRLCLSEVEEEISQVGAEEDNPEEALQKKEEFKRLREIVKELPDRQRKVIEGYYFKNMSFTDIATDPGEDWTKSWVSRLHARSLDTIRKKCLEYRK